MPQKYIISSLQSDMLYISNILNYGYQDNCLSIQKFDIAHITTFVLMVQLPNHAEPLLVLGAMTD